MQAICIGPDPFRRQQRKDGIDVVPLGMVPKDYFCQNR